MKKWYRSKTVWTNIGVFVASVVPILGSYFSDTIGTELALQIAAAAGVFNTILQIGIRVFVTGEAINRSSS